MRAADISDDKEGLLAQVKELRSDVEKLQKQLNDCQAIAEQFKKFNDRFRYFETGWAQIFVSNEGHNVNFHPTGIYFADIHGNPYADVIVQKK
ncbi:hypothetical protein [Schlesneria sp.]|uniref:hypothetical protein n=1 Tax=Schlesneria sp. TaxID=2762018 RepID=UPI002F16AC46